MSAGSRDTPMMRQYLAIKAGVPDALLFYRMGDFYELFLEDAEIAAPLLDIALTTRDKGKPDAIPMCGVPVHSAAGYVRKLAESGHRVAICEQVEDARRSGPRRLVRREVVEIITPGLVGDPEGLAAERELCIAALLAGEEGFGLAVLDASTGSFRATRLPAQGAPLPALLEEELERVAPRELLLADDVDPALDAALARRLPGVVRTRVPAAGFRPDAAPRGTLEADGAASGPDRRAAAALLAYVAAHQPSAVATPPPLRRYALGETMVVDTATRRHLELFESLEDGSRRGTLIERLDRTRTPLGARRLARFLLYPLLDPAAIRQRQDAVGWLAERDRLRGRLRAALADVRDLERLLARCARPGAEPRDLAALRASLDALPAAADALAPGDGDLVPAQRPAPLRAPEPLPELTALLHDALVEAPRPLPRGSRGANETGYVRAGFRAELDALREAAAKGREWIAGLEARERERIRVPSLKVRFHPVHGYALEVTKANLGLVPASWERKQTLANAERFTTAELREVESRVLGANERAAALEREIFEEVRQQALARSAGIRAAAEAVAELDALASLAEAGREDGWIRPEVDAGQRLSVRAGRHPVVESWLRRRGEDFVPNDCELDPDDARLLLLTGPNMSGKSTYLRQVALLVLLAQVGSLVPAESAAVGVVDRIFTRVGASDRLARGESTFMVEMRETAEILDQATRRSLILLDEIGRGTSTFDGLSIAWAVAEHLHDAPELGCRTLFATHYHELADLTERLPGLRNAHFQAREWQDEVLFLRRLVPGEASRSYGIQVAKLAGLPAPVIARAREILAQLDGGAGSAPRAPAVEPADQLPLFGSGASDDPEERAVLDELRAWDPERTTPLEALERLAAWRARLLRRGKA